MPSPNKTSRWILLLILAPALVAQSRTNWDSVKQLVSGQQIRLSLADGRNLRGQFQSATDDAVMVAVLSDGRTAGSQETLSRTLVAKASAKGESRRLRHALIGFGIGAGGGLITGAILDKTNCHPNLILGCIGGPNFGKEIFTPFGALVGGVVGALIPAKGWHEVYRAK